MKTAVCGCGRWKWNDLLDQWECEEVPDTIHEGRCGCCHYLLQSGRSQAPTVIGEEQ